MAHGTLAVASAALVLAACQPAPRFTLLFLDRSPAATLGEWSWAPVPDSSRIIAFDRRLHPVKTLTSPALATPVAVAALGTDLLVSERTGEAVVLDPESGALGPARREWNGPDAVNVYTAAGRQVVAARSPYDVPFVPVPDTAPLLRLLDTLGRPVGRIGTVHVPRIPFLAQLVNAGPVTADSNGAIYFAPLARDEIIKYDRTGAVRWTAARGLFAHETDPEVVADRRGAAVDARYAIVNIALALGPDGRLYALGASDSAGTKLRLDVLDTAAGKVTASRPLGARETAVAVTRDGLVATFDADSLLALMATAGRPPFEPPFALPDLHGDTVRLARFRGKVTLINFWASWCDPCREEFPHMAELYRAIPQSHFQIAAISDDVDRAAMLRFVNRFRPPFLILAGGGRMRAAYHYRGLPYSVLLDREGRIIERSFGFGGAREFARLRQTIAKEIRKP